MTYGFNEAEDMHLYGGGIQVAEDTADGYCEVCGRECRGDLYDIEVNGEWYCEDCYNKIKDEVRGQLKRLLDTYGDAEMGAFEEIIENETAEEIAR